jgi:hypothetical protein
MAAAFAFIAQDIGHWLGVPIALVIVAMVAVRKWGKRRMARRMATKETHSAVPSGPKGDRSASAKA